MRINEKWFLGIGILIISLLITAGLACEGGDGDDGLDGEDGGAIPSVTTSDASSVSMTSATLNGQVNPNGLDTTAHFEYGTTDSYGSSTATEDVGSGTTATAVTESLTGLAQGTTYHYRCVATNDMGTSNGADKTFTTLTQISIFNESPTYETSFTSDSTPVTISGSGSGPIDAITWKNNTNGQSGNVTGTTDWSVEVSLAEGDNEVEITASSTGTAAEDVTITLIITYNPYVMFTSLPQLTPSTGIAGTTYDPVYVRIGIDSTNLDTTSISVFKVDATGNKVGSALGSLTDDGNLLNGDEIQGDGIYSANISLSSATAGAFTLRIFASDNDANEQKTAVFSMNFFALPTTAQMTQQATNNNAAYNKFEELFGSAMLTQTLEKTPAMIQSFDEMVSYLKTLTGVVDAGTGSYGVWWLNETGMFSVLSLIVPEDKDYSGIQVESLLRAGRPDDPLPGQKGYDPRSTRLEYLKPNVAMKDILALQEDEDQYKIGSLNAIHIMPFQHTISWYKTTYPGGWYSVVEDSVCPPFTTVDEINEVADPMTTAATEPVPLSVWKSLSNYGLISSATHGDTMDIPKKELEEKYPALALIDWLFPWHDNRVILFTNIAMDDTVAALTPYFEDILAGRLMLWPEAANKVSLIITPEFISHYNGTFPNSIWINISCKGAFNNTLAAAFLAKGGGAWYGYSDYVSASYAHKTEKTILEKLIDEGKNAGEAFDAAVAAHGANEGGTTPAALVIHGEKKTKISDELKNPSFEDPDGAGSLLGWVTAGDGRAIKVLGTDAPTDGGTMAVISTGLGFTVDVGSILQSFCVPANAKNLIFDWNFYSEEFQEWCDTQYDDTFQVSIIDIETGVETVLFLTSVNILCGNLGALIKSPVEFDQGDTWYIGWQLNKTIDISAYKGKAVILKFFSTDKGDSIYDTVILIDNIRITTE